MFKVRVKHTNMHLVGHGFQLVVFFGFLNSSAPSSPVLTASCTNLTVLCSAQVFFGGGGAGGCDPLHFAPPILHFGYVG